LPYNGEDDLIEEHLSGHRRDGDIVLASGSIQGRFSVLIDGRRKYPDVVLVTSGTLVLAEAKIRGAELFRTPKGGLSDIEFLNRVASNPPLQVAVLDRANALLRSMGSGEVVTTVRTLALAAIGPPPGLLDSLGAVTLRIVARATP
jgi:hypothetical protein